MRGEWTEEDREREREKACVRGAIWGVAVGGGICDEVGKARRGRYRKPAAGNADGEGGGRLARWIVGIYHSRWRAVAARGTRQFTADRREAAVSWYLLSENHRATHAHASSRVFARVTRRVVTYVHYSRSLGSREKFSINRVAIEIQTGHGWRRRARGSERLVIVSLCSATWRGEHHGCRRTRPSPFLSDCCQVNARLEIAIRLVRARRTAEK